MKTFRFGAKNFVRYVCLHSSKLRHVCVTPHFHRFGEEVFRKTESHLRRPKKPIGSFTIKFHVTFYESSSSSISTKIPKHHSSLFVTLFVSITALSSETTFLRHNDSTTKLEEKEKRPSKGVTTTATATTASRGCGNSSSGRRRRSSSSKRLKIKKAVYSYFIFY